jgi:hypothetical protein
MIVNYRQWMATSDPYCKMPFEIHLPQLVRCCALKALPGHGSHASGRTNQLMAMQNRCHRTGRNLLSMITLQYIRNLAPAPRRMSMTYLQHHLFNDVRASVWTTMRTSGSILQSFFWRFLSTLEPLITRLTADIKTGAQLAYICIRLACQHYKFFSLLYHGDFFPRHHFSFFAKRKSVTHVPAHVLPMCPVYTEGREEGGRSTELIKHPIHFPSKVTPIFTPPIPSCASSSSPSSP